MERKVKVYIPNRTMKMGVWVWYEMFNALVSNRELIGRFFIRNMLGKYKQSVFGFLWIIFIPLVAIGTFMFLSKSGVMNFGAIDVPYPVFALIGISVWQLFSDGLSAGTESIVQSGSMVLKINFPIEVLVFSSMAHVIFEFTVKIALILISFAVFGYKPSVWIILFPVAVIPLMFFTLGLSMFSSLVNCVLRDTARIISLGVTFLLFLTPVMYPLDESGSQIMRLNPLTALVNAPRDLIIYGHIRHLADYIVFSVISVLFFFIAWRIFYVVETKMPERI
jgi:lipopolysaccharide transport system permease protein